ncbi:MAG: DUF1501 domain-containing protein [Pirellulaceae bacterium]
MTDSARHFDPHPRELLDRRAFFNRGGVNLGAAALGWLLARDVSGQEPPPPPPSLAARSPLAPKPAHFPARARSVIFLNMAGAPPQLDMLDFKPTLKRLGEQGARAPASLTKGERFAFIDDSAKLLPPLFPFRQVGSAGMWMSSVTDPLSDIADDICLIHGVHSDQFNHVPAALKLFTGFQRGGRPSMGAWVTYGLGSECDNLPGYVVLSSGRGARCGGECHGSGFLPSVYQGIALRSEGEPVLYLNNPRGFDRPLRRATLDALKVLNQAEFDAFGDPEIQTRISQYEMAYRMQQSAPELADLSSESAEVHDLYGVEPGKRAFANNCLLARRLVERGVRFIQLNHGEWDLHGGPQKNIPKYCPLLCEQTMQGTAALIKDLKRTGLLDSTLVVWGAEFGRTPMLQGELGREVGRDHHKTFSMWMAGAGVKAGHIYGETDDIGYKAVGPAMDVHDVQATILHLLGLDHERLTYRFQGRDFRLTDVHGKVHDAIFA